jgi:hypothetical protein
MNQFKGIDLQYTPLPISNDHIDSLANAPTTEQEDVAIVDKLVRHLNIIREYKDRLDAIDYLSANAVKLSGNPVYTTSNEKLISNIKDLGGSGNSVDFLLFQQAVDIVIEGYKDMALTTITGTNND